MKPKNSFFRLIFSLISCGGYLYPLTFLWDSKCKECVLEWNCWPVEFSDHFPDSDRGQGGIFIRVQFYAGQEEIGSWHKIDRLPSLRIFNEYYSCQILCPTLKINILVLFRSNNNPCSWDIDLPHTSQWKVFLPFHKRHEFQNIFHFFTN